MSSNARADVGAVSVIVPAFNPRSDWLRRALDSALGQTCPPGEVIVIDDGSTLDLSWITAEYGQRIKLIHQANGGPAVARNQGIHSARYPFVAFLDADDVWCPDKLALQLALFALHPDAGLIYSDAQLISELGEVLQGQRKRQCASGLILDELFQVNCIPNSSVIISRECLNTIGGFSEDRGLIGVEDYELWLRVAARFPIYAAPEKLIQYRVVMSGLSHQNPIDYKARERAVVARAATQLGTEHPRLRLALAARLCELYLQEVGLCRDAGLYPAAHAALAAGLGLASERAIDAPHPSELYVEEATKLGARGCWRDARTVLVTCLRLDPLCASAWRLLLRSSLRR